MTYGDIYKYWQTLSDKAQSPYFSEAEFDKIASAKLNDFVLAECVKSETDERHSIVISNLYKTFTKLNSDRIIFPDDIADFFYLLRFNQKYKKQCGTRVEYPVVNIRKAPNNNVDIMQNDPFNKGIDADPTYVITSIGGKVVYQVLSTTTPLEIGGTYCKVPQKINSDTAPNTVFELADFVAEEIVNSIVYKTDIIIENFPRAQAEAQEAAMSER